VPQNISGLPFVGVFSLLLGLCLAVPPELPGQLPGTVHWNVPQDIAAAQDTELRRYFEDRIAAAARERSAQAADKVRDQLRRTIGAVDRFLAPNPVARQIGATAAFTFSLVEWPVLPLDDPGLFVKQYGLLLEPIRPGKHPAVIAIPGAHLSAPDIAGLTARLPKREQYARGLAVNGYVVLAPFFTQRRTFSQPWMEDRASLVRLAYPVGRHLIGSEVQQISSAVDFLGKLPRVDAGRIGVAGSGQGGLTALYAAALDTRLKAALVARYFDRRDRAFEEPEDRILWKQMERFGDAEIAAAIAPRALVIDRGGPDVLGEYQRARALFAQANAAAAIRYSGEQDQQDGPTTAAIELFDEILHPDVQWPISAPQTPVDPEPFYAIANAQFSQWQARYRGLARRAAAGSGQPRPARETLLDTVGRYPPPAGALEARSAKLDDEPGFTRFRLSVRVYDTVYAYGILLVPNNIKPGERRPVVFAREGSQLARRGYIVFQTAAARKSLERRAHLAGLTLAGLEIGKAGRAIDFLETLPFVDKDRFALYCAGDGDLTAVWAAAAEPRFKAVVYSGELSGTPFLFDILHKFGAPVDRSLDPEIARLTGLYRDLGIPAKLRIQTGAGDAIPFLGQMLNWTPPR